MPDQNPIDHDDLCKLVHDLAQTGLKSTLSTRQAFDYHATLIQHLYDYLNIQIPLPDPVPPQTKET